MSLTSLPESAAGLVVVCSAQSLTGPGDRDQRGGGAQGGSIEDHRP